MNALQHMVDGPLVYRLGGALVHFLWEGLLIAVVLAAVLPLLRGRAGARHLAAWLTLVAMAICLPVTAWLMPAPAHPATSMISLPRAARSIDPVRDGQGNAALVQNDATSQSAPVNATAVPSAVASRPESDAGSHAAPGRFDFRAAVRPAAPWIVGLWLAGAMLLALWRVGGWFHLDRLRRRGTDPVSDAMERMLARLAERLEIRQAVRVVQSTLVKVPSVVGWLRPVVLLPVGILGEMPPQQLETILAHELAHIRRQDFLLNLVQTAIETLLFYHPAVWWASRRIRAEREACCDDMALAVTGDRMVYVHALASLAELRARPALASGSRLRVAADDGSLVVRIRRIMGLPDDDHRRRTPQVAGSVAALLLAASAAGFAAYGGTDGKQNRPENAAKGVSSPADAGRPSKKETAPAKPPVLKKGPGKPASDELIQKVLRVTQPWLRPKPQDLSYSFSMEHPSKRDRWEAKVKFTAPDQVSVEITGEEPYRGTVDDRYDPGNSASSPRRITLLQGVTLFGPLGELAMSPEDRVLSVVAEDKVEGKDAWVLHMTPRAKASENAIKRPDDPSREPNQYLRIRVGCGIWGMRYGGYGNIVDVDQVWVDKATGRVLREDGFIQEEPVFTITYRDFAALTDGGQVPRRIVVTLFGKEESFPWVFDMRFALVDGRAWLLSDLKESQGTKTENAAIAKISDATTTPRGDKATKAPAGPRPLAMPDERAEMMGRVEDFFLHNFRDVTWRKSLEWGDVQTYADGSRSIRYMYEARIWDRETIIANKVFAFDRDGKLLGFVNVEGYPKTKEKRIFDTSTKRGMVELVEDFFSKNFRDITSRNDLEWGEVEKHQDGTSSIRYKYVAQIWGKETLIENKIFTFDKEGNYVEHHNVEGYPKKTQPPIQEGSTNTKEGMIALVDRFFQNNFRDISSRKSLEWGDPEKQPNGNVSIRYKYLAMIWNKDVKTMNQVFTFDSKGKFASVKNVEGYPKEGQSAASGQGSVDSSRSGSARERVDEVHKKVTDFPDREDMSTPEAAYASIHRAYAAEGYAAFLRLSAPKIIADGIRELTQRGQRFDTKQPPPKEEAQTFLQADIVETHYLDADHAAVVARITRKGHDFNLRWFERVDGRWLNEGSDLADSLEDARKLIASRSAKAAP